MKNKKHLDWLTPENLFATKDILILPLEATPPQDGLVARCYSDGQLKFLGFYEQGTYARYWSLELEHGVEEGRASLCPRPNEMPSYETFRNGHSNRSDSHSDNSEPYRMDYEVWVRWWVKNIAGDVKAGIKQVSFMFEDD